MELRTLRYFLAVVDDGSVSGAAQTVHVTQPSLSRQLRQLEADLGLALFNRQKGRLSLSPAGRQFVPIARDLVARADAARAAARTLAAGRLQQLTIAAPGTTLTDVLAPFLATLRPDDPLPTVWEEGPTGTYAALARGADLAMGTEPPPHDLAWAPVAVLPLWAYVPPGHRWADRSVIELVELVQEVLILLTAEYNPRRVLDQAANDAGLRYGRTLEFGTPQVAQAVAAAGRGVAVVSDDPRFGLRPLDVVGPRGPLHINLYAAWAREHHAGSTLAALVRRLSEYCVVRYGPQVAPAR